MSDYLETKKLLLDGIEKVALNVVKSYGPQSKGSLIKTIDGAIGYTRDGYTISQKTTDGNEFGRRLIKSVTARQQKLCGDGTSTSAILFYELCKGIYDKLKYGYTEDKVWRIRYDLMKSADKILKSIPKYIANNVDKDLLFKVSKSCTGEFDESYVKLAKEITDLVYEVQDGDIKLLPSETEDTYSEVSVGCQRIITQMSKLMTENLKNPLVYVTSGKIDLIRTLPITQYALENKRDILLVCKSADDDSIRQFESMIAQGLFKGYLLPVTLGNGYTEDFINDIAFISKSKIDMNNEDNDLIPLLGSLESFNVKDGVHSFNSELSEDELNERIKELEAIDTENNNSLKYRINERLNFLRGKVGTLYIKVETEEELIEKKFKALDAISSVRSAIKYGVIPSMTAVLRDIKGLDRISRNAIMNIVDLLPNNPKNFDPYFTLESLIKICYSMAIVYLDTENLIIEERQHSIS